MVDAGSGGSAPVGGGATPATAVDDSTGNDVVDAVVARLGDLDTRPIGDHVAVYERAQHELHEVLAEAAEGPAEAAGETTATRPGR